VSPTPSLLPHFSPPCLSFSPKPSTRVGVPSLAGCRYWGPHCSPAAAGWGRGVCGGGEHGRRVNGMCQPGLPRVPWAQRACHPSHATLVVTVALAMPAGLVAQWSDEDQKHQQTISIPVETYAQGCVKDVEEGLEVKLSSWVAGCLLATIISPWSPFGLPAHMTAVRPSEWTQLVAILLRAAWGWGRVGCWGDGSGSKALRSPQSLTHLRWPRGSATL